MKLCTLLHLFMKKWFFCFWILSICAYAQKTDSLLILLGKLPADTSKVSVLYELGQSFWLQGNDSLSRLYSNQSVSLAQQIHDLKGEVKARLLLVRIENEYLSDLKTAYNHLDKALEIAKAIPDKLLEGQVYFRRAQIYTSFFEKQAEVQPLFQKALALFTEINAACLSVSDNGIGMTQEMQSEDIGMTNLNNRVATLSGKLTFQSKPEVGTKATIEVPI